MSWNSHHYYAHLGAEASPGRTASSYREHRGPVLAPTSAVGLPRRHHFHASPPYPHRYYNDYVPVEGWGWWPRWFPYWDRRWYDYWWYLYDYYGGDAYADYAEYARDAVLRQHAPQWGLTVSGSDAWTGWSGPALPATSATVRNYYGLEEALMDGLKRRAVEASARYARDPQVPAVAYLRVKGGQEIVLPYPSRDWMDTGSPIRQWWDGIAGIGGRFQKNYDAWEFAAIVAFDPQTRQTFVNSYALSPVIVEPLRALEERP